MSHIVLTQKICVYWILPWNIVKSRVLQKPNDHEGNYSFRLWNKFLRPLHYHFRETNRKLVNPKNWIRNIERSNDICTKRGFNIYSRRCFLFSSSESLTLDIPDIGVSFNPKTTIKNLTIEQNRLGRNTCRASVVTVIIPSLLCRLAEGICRTNLPYSSYAPLNYVCIVHLHSRDTFPSIVSNFTLM